MRWLRGRLAGPEVRASRVRRIARVCLPGQRVVAITFDDGPTAGLTDSLLETLERHRAYGTFDVIGSTAANYPDRAGRSGTPFWSGRCSDHYASFGRDDEAGVQAQPELARQLATAGHELANHSYRHLAFGHERLVYRGRWSFASSREALDDQLRLHALCARVTGQQPRLARPPHYINVTADGYSAFDIYEAMGYQYLGASFDLGGWRRTRGGLDAAVAAAVAPLRAQLEADPAALCGQILFAKDGYNMSLDAVAPAALPLQLGLLRAHGYRVVTVSELLAQSPYADTPPDAPEVACALRLAACGVPVATRDNRLALEARLTYGELVAWLAGPVLPPVLAAGGTTRPLGAGARALAACRAHGWPGLPAHLVPGAWVGRPELERVLARWDWRPAGGRQAQPLVLGRPKDANVSRAVALRRFAEALGDRAGPAIPLPGLQ